MAGDKNEAEVDVLKSQADKNRADTDRTRQLTPYEINQLQENVNESISRQHLNSDQSKFVRLQADRFAQMTPTELEKAKQELLSIKQSIIESKSRTRLNDRNSEFVEYQSWHQLYINNLDHYKTMLVNDFHIDPDSPWINQVIQTVASGDTRVIDILVDSITGLAQGFGHRVYQLGQDAGAYIMSQFGK